MSTLAEQLHAALNRPQRTSQTLLETLQKLCKENAWFITWSGQAVEAYGSYAGEMMVISTSATSPNQVVLNRSWRKMEVITYGNPKPQFVETICSAVDQWAGDLKRPGHYLIPGHA